MSNLSALVVVACLRRRFHVPLVKQLHSKSVSRMSIWESNQIGSFLQTRNPITGRSEWEPRCNDYDYHQEIARSAFADMLHDDERNEKYHAAIRKTIIKLHEEGKTVNVLDIGTGTGLLSMMAAKSGADSVTACEAFLPMANCAEQVIAANGFADKVKLIKKRSTEMKVGEDQDMKQRANVLVTEVFDTELIGEGAIGIFNHAHRELLTEDCVVIPSKARVYVQVINSCLVNSWNVPKMLANLDADGFIQVPKEIEDCPGESAVHDLQLSTLDRYDYYAVTEPIVAFEFDFSDPKGLPEYRRTVIPFEPKYKENTTALFMWWDLKMDQDDEILLSCAPYWAHPDYVPNVSLIPWRDHWMQAIYYFPKQINLTDCSEACLIAYHDDYSFWFDLRRLEEKDVSIPRFNCTCAFHSINSRSRIGIMNNMKRTKRYLRILEQSLPVNSVILSISDGSWLGLLASLWDPKQVYCLEPNRLARRVTQLYIEANDLKNVKVIESLSEIENLEEITNIIGEPHFYTSVLPWDNLYFGTVINEIKDKLRPDVCIMPRKAYIYALPVAFDNLHNIRAPVKTCEGFDHSIFDKMIEKSSNLADAPVQAHSLWEYNCRWIAQKKRILIIDVTSFDEPVESSGIIEILGKARCNGVVLYVDWSLDGSDRDSSIISTGPTQIYKKFHRYIGWDYNTRQGVYLFQQSYEVVKGSVLSYAVRFVPKTGDMQIRFKMEDYVNPTTDSDDDRMDG